MKKFLVILTTIASVALIMPVRVQAAEPQGFSDTDGDGVYVNDSAISAGRYGSFAAGDITWTYNDDSDETDGVKTWNFYLTVGSVDWDYLYMSFTPVGIEIDSITPGSSNFLLVDQDTTSAGSTSILVQQTRDLEEGDRVLLFTIRTVDTSDDECRLSFSPLNLDCSVNIPGIYFDNDGNEISAEEYEEVCGNTTPEDPNDVPNSETGSVIPYVAIGGGLIAIVAVYLFSRKSNKVYKI